jgi:hypothetical protein
MVEPLRHRQTKGAATDMFYLTPPRHISTLHLTDLPPQSPHVCYQGMNGLGSDAARGPSWTQTGHANADLDRLSPLVDHASAGEPGRCHGRRRLAAEAGPRTV